jgi:inorganic pyrophosphatase
MQARAIGVMDMADEGREDAKIIAVHVNDPAYNEFIDIDQLPHHIAREIHRFFEDYKALEDKEVIISGMRGAQAALEVVRASFDLYRTEENRLRGWG